MTSEISSEALYELFMLAAESHKLDSAEVLKLESELENAPSDLSIRVRLLSYYRVHDHSGDKCLQHLLWYIENTFEGEILAQVGVARSNGAHLEVLKKAWMEVIENDPKNLMLLKKAIAFFKNDFQVANEFKELACQVDQENEGWPRDLSAYLVYEMTLVPAEEAEKCLLKAIHFGKEALERHKRFPQPSYLQTSLDRFVNELTEPCFRFNRLDDAKYFGNYLVENAQRQQNNGESNSTEELPVDLVYRIHIGHSIQGRAALQENDFDLALKHLGEMPFYVDVDFEYDLALARDLLDKGQKSAVCGYLDDCIQNLSTTLERTIPGDPVYDRALKRCENWRSEIDYPIRRVKELIEQLEEWITSIYASEEVELPTHLVRDFRMKDLGVPHFRLFKIEPGDVPKFEKKLRKDPSDLHTRLLLIKYHDHAGNDEMLEHLLWLIENKPETDFKHYNIWVGPKYIDAIEAAWLAAIEKDINNPTILRNAISCCGPGSGSRTTKWLERGYEIDPLNEEWPRKLSFQYYLRTSGKDFEEAKSNAIKSIQFGKEAIERYKRAQKDGEFSIEEECKQHANLCLRFDLLDDAQYFGDFLVEHGHARQRTWDGNATSLLSHVSAVHKGHSILGRVALHGNDIEQVLLQLAKMPFHVSIDFSPDVEFAQDLIDNEKIDTVCAYLDDCKQNFTTVLNLMIEEGPFYMAVLQDHDMPFDGPGYLLDNLRRKISEIEEWQTAIRDGNKIKLPEHY